MLFTKVLPWYKENIRGPALPFEYLEEELKSKSGWPPIGDCKNNEIKIGMQLKQKTCNFDIFGLKYYFYANNIT